MHQSCFKCYQAVIGHLHDDVIRLQLPECFEASLRDTKDWSKMHSGRCSQMMPSCKLDCEQSLWLCTERGSVGRAENGTRGKTSLTSRPILRARYMITGGKRRDCSQSTSPFHQSSSKAGLIYHAWQVRVYAFWLAKWADRTFRDGPLTDPSAQPLRMTELNNVWA